MTLKRWIIGIFAVVALLHLLACGGEPFSTVLLLCVYRYGSVLLIGWIQFLARVLVDVRVDPTGVTLAVVATIALTLVVHYQLRHWRNGGVVWRFKSTVAVIAAAFGSCIASICLVGLTHELQWMARGNDRIAVWSSGWKTGLRAHSRNNLKQIGLGMHLYHDWYKSFPLGGTFDARGTAMHGWMTFLLPSVDHAELYRQVDLSRPWNDPIHRAVFETRVNAYEYSQSAVMGYAAAGYAANSHVLRPGSGMSIAEIVDGTSMTITAGEANGNFKPWGHPANWRDVNLGINQSPEGFGSPWIGGAHFLFADGSVKFLSERIDPRVLRSLATPAGREAAEEF